MHKRNTNKATGCIQTKEGRANYYVVLNSYDKNSKRIRKWIYTDIPIKGDSKRKIKAKLAEILAEQGNEYVDFSKDTNFVIFMQNWLETYKLSISITTYDAYKIIMNAHVVPFFEQKKLKVSDVTPAVIQQYVSFKLSELSPNTVRKHLANISSCLDTAVKQNIISVNPVKRIELPKKEKYNGAKIYNEKQIERLLEISKDDPLEIVILLTLFYGLRRSEILGLMWRAIDFDSKTIAIKHTVVRIGKDIHKLDRTKNDSSYTTFPIPDKIISELKKLYDHQQELKSSRPDYQDNGYVCTKPTGELYRPDFITQHFRRLIKNNDMPHIRFHDLRHSSASFLKYLGFDLKDIQIWLRHKDIQTTMNLYTHLDMSAKLNISNSLDARFQLLNAK
jgi:integrase